MDVKKKSCLQSPVFSFQNKLIRVLWGMVYHIFFRLSPTPFFTFRRWLLILFGAKIGSNVNIYPTVKIWLPSNLIVMDGAGVGPDVQVYNQGFIHIGKKAIISQGAYLCASTHDYNDRLHPLIVSPITIENNVWICSEAFVGPGVVVSDGGVVGARAVITRNTEPWSVYAGNPATKVNERKKINEC